MKNNIGYHKNFIKKGIFGELSKIYEEVDELKDSEDQGSKIMILLELSDIVGSIDGYLKKYYPNLDINDLYKMSKITERAFKNGHRK